MYVIKIITYQNTSFLKWIDEDYFKIIIKTAAVILNSNAWTRYSIKTNINLIEYSLYDLKYTCTNKNKTLFSLIISSFHVYRGFEVVY